MADDLYKQILTLTIKTIEERTKVHGGAKKEAFQEIADLWRAYLINTEPSRLTPLDVLRMLALLKIGRSRQGEFNLDDYVDIIGYTAIAGDVAKTQNDLERQSEAAETDLFTQVQKSVS